MRFTRATTRLLSAMFFFLVVLATFGQNSYRDLKQTGPRNLVIVYRCAPENRLPLRNYMTKTGLDHFRNWQEQGVLQNFRILFNRYVDGETWDMLAILQFENSTNVAEWAKVERSFVGGLEPEAVRLVTTAVTYSMDLVSMDAWPKAASKSKSVFMVIPYNLDTTTPDEYFNYARGYVEPQLRGWMQHGVLKGWSLFINRYFPGRSWQSMLVLEYPDESALGQRDKVIAEVRSELAKDEAWKAFSDNKHQIRRELQIALAEELTVP